jgi:mycoredoxin
MTAESKGQIILYTRPWCGSVMRVKRWFDQRGIPYTEVDISRDRRAACFVEELNNGYQSVPTIVVDGQHLVTEPSTGDLERLFGK